MSEPRGRRRLAIVLAILAMLMAVPLALPFILAYLLLPRDVTDLTQYQDILRNRWQSQARIDHFPDPLPSEATEIRLAYFPGFLSTDKHLQVRMKLPAEKIEQLYRQFSGKAVRKFKGGNWNDHANQVDGVGTTFFYTGDAEDRRFPESYELLVLQSQGETSGVSSGVAIDREAHEIVYWAEVW